MNFSPGKIFTVLLVGFLGLGIYRSGNSGMTFAADGTDARWDAAVQEAKGSGKPTIVLFTADWCPACRQLHSAFTRPEIAAELDRYYCFKVDLTNPRPADQEHAKKYGAEYIPLMIRFDRDGKETARTNSLPPERLAVWLKEGK